MKKIIVLIFLMWLFALPVRANDSYGEQYENIVGNKINNALDEQTRDFFSKSDIDAKKSTWVNNLTTKNVFSHIWEVITSGAKTPIKSGILIAAVIFLTASLTAFGVVPRFETAVYAAVLCIGVLIAKDVWQCVSTAVDVVKGCSAFMLAFVPVFATVVMISGKTITAASMSALLLGVAELVSGVSSFAVLPLMGGYLALSISSGVSPLFNSSGIVESFKKLSMWIMSLLGTLFIGVLGIQTAVNSAADSVALRTTKFILGTCVPVAGGVLSEAVSTVSTSVGLLRSSIGIYGVVALGIMLIPIVIEIILWRCVLMLDISLSEMFSLAKISAILRAIDSMLSVLLGVVLLVGGLFIISLSVVVSAGKT